jgi:hypothetical protein
MKDSCMIGDSANGISSAMIVTGILVVKWIKMIIWGLEKWLKL